MDKRFSLVSWVVIVSFLLVLGGCSGHWNLPQRPPPTGNEPAIRITQVEWWKDAFGNITQIFVKGHVYNVKPKETVVSIWIYVPGAGWWPKPTFAHPLTAVDSDGNWHNRVVTGGHDEDVTEVRVFLLRKNTWHPTRDGMPGDVDPSQGILAMDEVQKPSPEVNAEVDGVRHIWHSDW